MPKPCTLTRIGRRRWTARSSLPASRLAPSKPRPLRARAPAPAAAAASRGGGWSRAASAPQWARLVPPPNPQTRIPNPQTRIPTPQTRIPHPQTRIPNPPALSGPDPALGFFSRTAPVPTRTVPIPHRTYPAPYRFRTVPIPHRTDPAPHRSRTEPIRTAQVRDICFTLVASRDLKIFSGTWRIEGSATQARHVTRATSPRRATPAAPHAPRHTCIYYEPTE